MFQIYNRFITVVPSKHRSPKSPRITWCLLGTEVQGWPTHRRQSVSSVPQGIFYVVWNMKSGFGPCYPLRCRDPAQSQQWFDHQNRSVSPQPKRGDSANHPMFHHVSGSRPNSVRSQIGTSRRVVAIKHGWSPTSASHPALPPVGLKLSALAHVEVSDDIGQVPHVKRW